MAKTRLYKVTTPNGLRLIEAESPSRAIAYIVRKEIKAEKPTDIDIAHMVTAGIKVEVDGDDPISDETRSVVAQQLIPETAAA